MEPIFGSAATKAIVDRAASARVDLVWRLFASFLAFIMIAGALSPAAEPPLTTLARASRWLGVSAGWATSLQGWFEDAGRRDVVYTVSLSVIALSFATHIAADHRYWRKLSRIRSSVGPKPTRDVGMRLITPEEHSAQLKQWNERLERGSRRQVAAESEFGDATVRCASTAVIALAAAVQCAPTSWVHDLLLLIAVVLLAGAVGAVATARETELPTASQFGQLASAIGLSALLAALSLPAFLFSVLTGY